MRAFRAAVIVAGVLAVSAIVAVAFAQSRTAANSGTAYAPQAQSAARVAPAASTPSFIRRDGEYVFFTTKGKMEGEVEEVTSTGWIQVAFESEFDKRPVWVNLSQVSFIYEKHGRDKD
jgi:hypothetical protein